jgi:hypothetical protein
MNRSLAALVLLLLPAAALAQGKRPDPAQYGWHTDYDKARAEARRTGKPIFLVFRCEP